MFKWEIDSSKTKTLIRELFPTAMRPRAAFRVASLVVIPEIAEKNRESFEYHYRRHYNALCALKARASFFLRLSTRDRKLIKKYDQKLREWGWASELDGDSDELFLNLTLTIGRCFKRAEELGCDLSNMIKGFGGACAENERLKEIHPNYAGLVGVFSSFGGYPASRCEKTGVCVCKNRMSLFARGERLSSFEPPYTYSCIDRKFTLPIRLSK